MKKTLIVYFSHRKENYVAGIIKELTIGNTELVANEIKTLTNGELFEIKPLHDYPFKYHECTNQAKQELENKARPKILNIVNHFEEYENIFVGYPNWWSTMPMCVWTFLESYDFTGKSIYPFCTHEGSGLGRSIEDIKSICPNAIVHQGLEILGNQAERSSDKINQWVKEQYYGN